MVSFINQMRAHGRQGGGTGDDKADSLRCALRVYRFLGLFCWELEAVDGLDGPIREKCG